MKVDNKNGIGNPYHNDNTGEFSSADNMGLNDATEIKEYNQKEDSEGKPLSQNEIENLKYSKVRDNEGRLLSLYRGAKKEGFDLEKYYFFSTSEDIAKSYGDIKKYYLDAHNILDIDCKGSNWSSILFNIDSETSELPSYLEEEFEGIKWLKKNEKDFKDLTIDQFAEILKYAFGSQARKLKISENEISYPIGPFERTKISADEDGLVYLGQVFTFIREIESPLKEKMRKYYHSTDDIADYAYKKRYDGVIFRNVVDVGGENNNDFFLNENEITPVDNVAIFDHNNIYEQEENPYEPQQKIDKDNPYEIQEEEDKNNPYK